MGIADPAIPLFGGRGWGRCEENRRAWQLTKRRLHSGQALLPTTTTTLLCSVLCPHLPLFLEGPFLKLQAYLVQMRKLRPRQVKINSSKITKVSGLPGPNAHIANKDPLQSHFTST